MQNLLDLCEGLPERHFQPGDWLLREGDRSEKKLFFLQRGALEVIKGEDVRISVLSEPGTMVGEMSVLLKVPISASVRAVEETVCFVAADGEEFFRAYPAAMLAVARLLAQRLHMATTYLADIKRQYEGHDASLAMVDQVLETFLHHHAEEFEEPGSEREREPNT